MNLVTRHPLPVTRHLSPLIWLAAFVCALYPVNDWQLGFMAASILLLLLWSYDRLARALKEGLSVPRSALVVLIAGLWVLSFASIFWSAVPWNSTLSFFFMGALPITFLTLAFAPYARSEWTVILGGAAIIMALLGLWALAQVAFFSDYFKGRAVHPLRDPSSLAALFNLALIPALGWMSAAQGRSGRILSLGLAVILLGGLIATGSRGAVLMFALGLVALAVLQGRALLRARKRWIMLALVLAAFLFLPQLVTKEHYTALGRISITLGLEKGEVSGNRLQIWNSTWDMIGDHWLTGTGIGTFYMYYPAYRSPEQRDLTTHAHNDPLQMWAEMGIAAPLLIYGFLILAAAATFRRLKELPPEAPERAPLVFSFVALGVLMAHSHINLNLYNLSILLLAGMGLAYWFAQLNGPRPYVSLARVKTKQAVLAAVFAVPMIVYGCMIGSEVLIAKAHAAIFADRIDLYGDYMLLSDRLAFGENPDVYLTAVNIPLTLLRHRKGEMTIPDIKKEAAQINGNLINAQARNPLSSAVWYYKGLLAHIVPVEARPEGLPDAAYSFARALELDPLHSGARLALIDLALKDEQYEQAGRLIEPSLHARYYTDTAREIYLRGLMVFSILKDDARRAQSAAMLNDYDKRAKRSRWVKENAPWRGLGGPTLSTTP